jgi:CheY-like chemotaxis protein
VPAASSTPPLWTTRAFATVTPPVCVLIVDDDENVASALQVMLETEGFIAGVADSTSTLKLIGLWIPHIVVLDIEMPIRNGFDLTRTLRQIAHMRLVPIIAHTSLAEDDVVTEGIASGIDAYCNKSNPPTTLLTLLRHMTPLSLTS